VDHLSYQSSVTLILNKEEMRPLLILKGIDSKGLNLFYHAYLNRDFNNNQAELAQFIKEILITQSLMIATYFASIIDYYLNSFKGMSTVKPLIINSVTFKLLRKQIDSLKSIEKLSLSRRNSRKVDEKPLLLKNKTIDCVPEKKQDYDPTVSKCVINQPKTSPKSHQEPSAKILTSEESLRFFRAFRKFALYTQYLGFFKGIKAKLTQVSEDTQGEKAYLVDKSNFDKAFKNLSTLLSEITFEQNKIKSECEDSSFESLEFEFKDETLKLQKNITELPLNSLVADLIHLHNQSVSALLIEIRAQKITSMSVLEKNIIDNINSFLLISLTEMSRAQQNTIFWLEDLSTRVQVKALKDPLFCNCQPGFLISGIYGSFIAKAFTLKKIVPLTHYNQDIDTIFYIDKKCTNNQPLSITQYKQLEALIHSELTVEAQRRVRSFLKFSTWHGFEYQGQECDITLSAVPPVPVVSHCCILYRLNEHQVQFLENGEHALLHMKANKLNIIAPKDQHSDPVIMAHILKKTMSYLQDGVKLTLQSKIILGFMLLNEEIALPTICRFLSFYGCTNPETYARLLTDITIPFVIQTQKQVISIADYLIRKCLMVYPHLDANLVCIGLKTINFRPLLSSKSKLVEKEIYVFIHQEIQRYLSRNTQPSLANNRYPIFNCTAVPMRIYLPRQHDTLRQEV
jgi:hypothetical protein